MTVGNQVVQIYCADLAPLGGSLAAVASTVKGCFARVDAEWPTEGKLDQWADVFY